MYLPRCSFVNMSDKEKIVEVAHLLFNNPHKYAWATRMFKILFDGNHVLCNGKVDVENTGCTRGDCTHCKLSSNRCLCPKVCKCHKCYEHQKINGKYVDDVIRYATAEFQEDEESDKSCERIDCNMGGIYLTDGCYTQCPDCATLNCTVCKGSGRNANNVTCSWCECDINI